MNSKKVHFIHKQKMDGYWGRAQSSRKIWVYANATQQDVSENPRFIVHEMGHAFENVLAGTLGAKKGRNELPQELRNRDGGFYGASGDWQWNREVTPGEIFADMFIGWVYNRWEVDKFTNELTELGQKRADYMNSKMGVWIVYAVLVRLGRGQ